jgi:hypothetical protein
VPARGWCAQVGSGHAPGLGRAGTCCVAGNTTISKERAVQEVGAGVWGRSASTDGSTQVEFTSRYGAPPPTPRGRRSQPWVATGEGRSRR